MRTSRSLIVAASLALPHMAAAQTPPASIEALEERAGQARELNRQGIKMLDVGDVERALEYFSRSRALLPGTKNTANAAICLDRLGKLDEALELYEELLVKYADGLDDEDRKNIGPAMAALRKKVGSIVVTSTAGGTAVVDGRRRVELPTAAPVRVLAGKRAVRVLKSGFETFETTVDVPAGETRSIDAKLVPLRGVGQLVVDDARAPGADVFVDRVRVGKTPWEGSVAPGRHVVWIEGAEHGTAPANVVVIEGQASLVRTASSQLGAHVRIAAEPRTATLDLGGVALGSGAWRGRLPLGAHTVVVSEPGYVTRSVAVRSELGRDFDRAVRLDIDPAHPRWPKRDAGRFWADAHGGYLGGPTLGADAEQGCPDACDDEPVVSGLVAGMRAGYRFPAGWSLELGAGYMRFGTSFSRREQSRYGDAGALMVHYVIDDDLVVHGPYGSLGASYRHMLGRFFVQGRVTAGLMIASATDPIVGMASTTGAAVPVRVENRNAATNAAAPFLVPEYAVGMHAGPVDVALSIAIAVFPADGPRFEDRGRFGATSGEGVDDPGHVANAKESELLDDERAFRRFVAWSPQLSLGLSF